MISPNFSQLGLRPRRLRIKRYHVRFRAIMVKYIGYYITWPRGDRKFLFECWKIFHEWAQRTSEVFFETRKEISYLQAAMKCSIYYINNNEIWNHFTFRCERRDLLCSHSNGDLFMCEDNMLSSRVKISCFRAKAYLVFHWCLYNKHTYHNSGQKITFLEKLFVSKNSLKI